MRKRGKETCASCEARLTSPVSFCPSCGRPTRHATEAQRLEWDLQQWRAHQVRSGARAATVVGAATRTAVAPVMATAPAQAPARVAAPSMSALPAPHAPKPGRRLPRPPRIRSPRLPHVSIRRRRQPEVIVLDADHPFVYRACSTCERTDWIVRTTRNEDGTWNYWCVRCSRSFKTDLKLRQALKPIFSAGFVLGGIAALSVVLR